MATITKTFVENGSVISSTSSTWTLTISNNDFLVSGSSFTLPIPTVTASYTCSSEKHNAYARIYGHDSALRYLDVYWRLNTDSGSSSIPSFEPGTTKTLIVDDSILTPINTSYWFNSNNPTTASIPISLNTSIELLSQRSSSSSLYRNTYDGVADWDNVYNVVLNAPPTFDVSALSKGTDGYYIDHTVVSVTVSNVDIKYGGNLSSVVFNIGSQSTGAPSATTFYIRLNTLGTFTPTVAVKDSRGQTTYYRFSPITVVRKPPTCTATVTSSAPYIINETAYTVNITNATATDATVSNIKLKIGNQTVSRSNDGTLSITPNTNGTFNPNVVITDSNGTSKTYTLSQITVQSPSAPTYNVTSTTSAPYVRTKNSYAVSITNATASYGGTVSSTRLTVGSQTVTGSVSSGTGTLTINPLNVAGTFTPSVEVTDNRGLTKTQTLSSITVLDYNAPSMSMSVIRCDSSGVAQDEGTYALVTAQITYSNARCNLKKPYMVVTNQSGTAVSTSQTWYTDSSLSNAVNWTNYNPNSPVTLYCLVSGNFTEQAYNIACYVEDSLNTRSSTISQTLPPSFYTIDIQAGGKEIAFGKPANDNVSSYSNGLFRCAMEIEADGNINIASGKKYKINGTALSSSDVGAVPTTRKVNNKALSSDITLSSSDVGAVPTTRKVNNKALSSDITLSSSDVGALPTSGGTMTGQILTSFNNSVATGSYQAAATTVPNLVEEVRFSSGCMGSVSIGTDYTANGVTITAGWYNFLYIPHRSGGVNGSASGDNCNYGNMFLFGMNNSYGRFIVRVSSSAITEVCKLLTSLDRYTRSSAGGLDWTNNTEGDTKVIMKSALAFWNGSFNGTTSNLSRCASGTILGSDTVKDYIIETGTSGIFNYRKWNNGLMELTGRYSGAPTTGSHYTTSNGFYGYRVEGIAVPTFKDATYCVSADWKIGSGFSFDCGQVTSRTTKKFNEYALASASGQTTVQIDFYIVGYYK